MPGEGVVDCIKNKRQKGWSYSRCTSVSKTSNDIWVPARVTDRVSSMSYL